MALFQQIKELLGLNSGESDTEMPSQDAGEAENVAVTVEHEPDTESEDAVKGTRAVATSESSVDTSTDAETDTDAAEDAVEGDDEPVESADTETDEPDESAEAEASEEAETAGEGTAATADDPTDGAESDSAASASTEPVQSINGIGPAYAERLAEADIETVGELAAADADAVAETTGIATSRVEGWIDQAGE